MQSKKLPKATTVLSVSMEDQVNNIVQVKKYKGCISRKQESYLNQWCGPTYSVISKAQILCFAGLCMYPVGAIGLHVSMGASFCAAVTKTGS